MKRQTIDEMRTAIFTAKKTFGEEITKWGDATWKNYYTQDHQNLTVPIKALLNAVEMEVTSIFGDAASGVRARTSLETKQWASSADHHGLLCHSYFHSSNLAQSASEVRKGTPSLVTLSFGNISLGNDSFPRGFYFHDADFKESRFFFKTLQDRRSLVTTLPPCGEAAFGRECERILSGHLGGEARDRLEHFLFEVRNTEKVWTQSSYSAQLTVMNTVLWNCLFNGGRGDIFYVEIDSIVRRLLEEHLTSDSVISDLIFNPAWRARYLELFEGIPGAHTKTGGTHFFWHADQRGKRFALRLRGEELVSENGAVSFPLQRDALLHALRNKEIIAGSALLLIIIHGEGRLALGGGLSQLDYLKSMMCAWNILREEQGLVPLPPLSTNIVSGDYLLFEIEDTLGERKLPSLIDLLLYADNPTSFVEEALDAVRIQDTIDVMIPTLHRFVTREIIPTQSSKVLKTLRLI